MYFEHEQSEKNITWYYNEWQPKRLNINDFLADQNRNYVLINFCMPIVVLYLQHYLNEG